MKRSFPTLLAALFLLGLLVGLPMPAHSAPAKYVFKIASLAPDGSVWAKRFSDFAEEIKQKTNGEVAFKIYPGGVMGDDRSMYRKMRVGQIQAGGFTMTGISEVVHDFRVLGLPFLFESYEEIDHVANGLMPRFKKAFDEQNMVLLGLTEVGFLYGMSVNPLTTIEEFRQSKAWIPEGDPISHDYLKAVGISPTPLAIPDVLTSLQTGLIDTVFNSFYGSIVLQWFTRTRYITNMPFAYSYGALAFDKRSYSKLPKEYAAYMEEGVRKHFSLLLEDTRQSNRESLDVLKKNGIELVAATPEAQKELRRHRDEMISSLVGDAFSAEMYNAMQRLLRDYRAQHTMSKK